jgi:hypothetical protein
MGWLGRGGIYKLNNNLWLRQTGTRGYESTYPILTDPIRLVYDESSDTYEPKEVVTYTEQRLRVDKDKSKQARTECKQFLMWLKAIAPVMEGSKVQYVPPESPQKDRIRHICTHPADINKIRDMNKHLTNVNELPLKNYVAAIQELKHMLTCGDDAEFLEFLHYVTGGKVFNKKTLLARVNRIMNHIFDVYYVEQVEIKAGSGNT